MAKRRQLSTTARGLGGRHQAERKRWAPIVATGTVPCVRCGHLIAEGAAWHLDHSEDRAGWLGPAHARCNLSAGGRLGNERKRAKKALEQVPRPKWRTSREW